MNIKIDGKEYKVDSGKNLLEVCLGLGIDIPYFCYHPALCSVGACRLCAVKSFSSEDDSKGKIIMSCMEPVREGMIISTKDAEVKEFRAAIIESLMLNHPHDCPICDEGGECHLQDMTVMTGHTYRNNEFPKRTYRNQYLGPLINHEMNRCIQCYRCVRFYKDYAGGKDLDVFASRSNVYFGRHEDGVLESEFSGNLAEVCPTGVFTDKTLKKHYTRKWDMTNSPSVCAHCSLGCNTIISERYGILRRVSNRYNSDVNGYFLCDRGRFGYEFVNSDKRIKSILHKNKATGNFETITEEHLIQSLKPIFDKTANDKPGCIIGIGSGRSSLESNFVLKQIVGDDNFYSGTTQAEYNISALIVNILNSTSAKIYSLKDIEKADAALILGEDITNTAPMASLAVRQAVRQKPLEKADKMNIPRWNDQAVRNLLQDKKGPLYIASPYETKLDEIATDTHIAAPSDIARLGFAIAHFIDNSYQEVEGIDDAAQKKAVAIAEALKTAKNPVVISGANSQSPEIISAASCIANALSETNNSAGIFYALTECNSMGLFLLGGKSLNDLPEENIECLVILENDILGYAGNPVIRGKLKKASSIITLEHTENATTLQSDFVIPVSAFAESNGIYINNEARAQNFYSVFPESDIVKGSWKWLMTITDRTGISMGKNFDSPDELHKVISQSNAIFNGIEASAPSADFRINGSKIPRQTPRFSGRTSINAGIDVSEPKPPDDNETALAFTMEGFSQKSITDCRFGVPFYWSPGWNSVQALNKYQMETGGMLYAGNTGCRLINQAESPKLKSKSLNKLYANIPETFKASENELLIVEMKKIFGSEALSSLSPAIAELSPESFLLVNKKDADRYDIKNMEKTNLVINETSFRVSVRINSNVPEGAGCLFLSNKESLKFDFPAGGKIQKIL